MRLILVRHGETLANAEGRIQGQLRGMFPLAPEGRAQAEKLREKLLAEGLQPTRVYASPLERAAETAEILASGWPVSVEHWDDLMEHGLGVASGLTMTEVAERFPEIDRERPDFWKIEGAEPLEGRRARAERVVAALLARHSDDDVVVAVCHGGILQNILAVLLGTSRTWGLHIRNTAVFDFTLDLGMWDEGGESLLDHTYWRINKFNDASHLD